MSKSFQPYMATLAVLLLLLAVPAVGQTVGSTESNPGSGTFNKQPADEELIQVSIVAGQTEIHDGQALTYFAVTDPPGFEDQVQWSADTTNGNAEPSAGVGQEFTIFFAARDLCPRIVVNAFVETFNGESATATLIQEGGECPDLFIPAGEDCWETEKCETIASFCASPLPKGFFGKGSLRWKDRIPLQGSQGIGIDTVIQRLDGIGFNGLGTANTRIRLRTVDLEGCDKITVEFSDGHTEQWSVEVKQSDFAQPVGNMTITRDFSQGGTFDSTFGVHVKYVFTNCDDPSIQRVLDTGSPDNTLQPILLGTNTVAPWVSQLQSHVQIPICGANFHPGVRGGAGGLRQCCKDVGHAGPGHLHVTGQKCQVCPDGGCKDTANLTCRMTTKDLCTQPNEVFLGAGTDCKDSDGDGLVDRVEKNDCCRTDPQDACNALTDPSNPDTDGDGVNDGQEILNGTDPCDPTSF